MSNLEQELRDAAAKGEVATVRKLLHRGINPNAPNAAANTALHYAASVDERKTVEALLAAGANPEARNRYGATPLDIAIRDGRDEAVEALSTTLRQMKRNAGSNVTE